MMTQHNAEPRNRAEEAVAGDEAANQENRDEQASSETDPGAEAFADPESGESEAAAIADLQNEIAGLKDQLLRAVAETENVRRRAEREREEMAKYAVAGFARDVLTVADNLARALESVPEEAREADERLRNLCDGVEMTRRELDAILERHKIHRIEPMGQPFDHNYHQAMFEVEDTDAPPGTVVNVMQSGYLLHDRLLRPAMVGVAKKRPEREPVDTEA